MSSALRAILRQAPDVRCYFAVKFYDLRWKVQMNILFTQLSHANFCLL